MTLFIHATASILGVLLAPLVLFFLDQKVLFRCGLGVLLALLAVALVTAP